MKMSSESWALSQVILNLTVPERVQLLTLLLGVQFHLQCPLFAYVLGEVWAQLKIGIFIMEKSVINLLVGVQLQFHQ